MWNHQKHQRLQQLRHCQSQLTEMEQEELATLIQELEIAESRYLVGATERLRHEREAVEKENAALERLAARKKNLLDHMQHEY